MPKVSVIMPVYNTKESYLREAIESILNQTYTDFEFIILNDGSTQDVASVIKSYTDSRIKFIDNLENKGFIGALNECLDIATGEFIAKTDSDDVSLPTRLEKQVRYLEHHKDIGLVGSGFRFIGGKSEEIIRKEKVGILDFLGGCVTTIFMLRRSVVEKYNLRFRKEYKYAEDYDFYIRFARCAEIRNIPEILYLYRWHENNVSSVKEKEQLETTNKIRSELLNFLTKDLEVQKQIEQVSKTPISSIKKKYYLFHCIPFLTLKQKGNTCRYFLFNIPILRKAIQETYAIR